MDTKKRLKHIQKEIKFLIKEVDKAPGGDYTIGVQCFFIADELEKLAMELTPKPARNLKIERENQIE